MEARVERLTKMMLQIDADLRMGIHYDDEDYNMMFKEWRVHPERMPHVEAAYRQAYLAVYGKVLTDIERGYGNLQKTLKPLSMERALTLEVGHELVTSSDPEHVKEKYQNLKVSFRGIYNTKTADILVTYQTSGLGQVTTNELILGVDGLLILE